MSSSPPVEQGGLEIDLACYVPGRLKAAAVVRPYRFTVKRRELLVPPPVVTVTVRAPYLAVAGTLHLICTSLQEG